MNPVKGLQNKSLRLESGQYVTQQLLEGSQAPFTVKDLLYRCSPVRPVCCGTWHSSTSPRQFSVAVQTDVTSARLHSVYLHPGAARDMTRAWNEVWLVVCRRRRLENQKVKVILVYTLKLRPAWPTGDLVSKKTKTKTSKQTKKQ